MATTAANEYRPDHAVSPGSVLEERLTAHGISHADLASRCECSVKLISDIVAGKAPVEPKLALRFERALGVDADIWLGIEKDYRLHERSSKSGTEGSCGGGPTSDHRHQVNIVKHSRARKNRYYHEQ